MRYGSTLMPFPLGYFVCTSAEDEDVYNKGIFKKINYLGKNFPFTTEQYSIITRHTPT